MTDARLRIVVVSQDAEAITRPLIDEGFRVVGVVDSAPRFYAPSRRLSRVRLSHTLRGWLQPRRSLKSLAKERAIPYFLLHRDNGDQLPGFVRTLAPDLLAVHSMSQLLKEDVLALPKAGALNLHPSLLPAYRGAAPRFWVYRDQAPSYGVTLHYLDRGEDTGDIISQDEMPMCNGLPFLEYEQKILASGRRLLFDALHRLEAGEALPRSPQPKTSPTARARRPKPSDYRLAINWSEASRGRVWHLLRGIPEWPLLLPEPPPGRFARLELVSECELPPGVQPPGTLSKAPGGRWVLHCRDGGIEIAIRRRPTTVLRGLLKR